MSTAMLALSSNATRARVRVRVGGQSSSSSSSSRVVLRRRSASNHLRLQRLTTTVTRAEDPKKEDVGGAEADEFPPLGSLEVWEIWKIGVAQSEVEV